MLFNIIQLNGHSELSATRDNRLGYEGRSIDSVGRRIQVGGVCVLEEKIHDILSPYPRYVAEKGFFR